MEMGREIYPELAESAEAGDKAEADPFAAIGSSEGTPASVNPYASPTAPTEQGSDEGEDGAITPTTRRALAETRPWVLFLSILMFIGAGFMLLAGFFFLVGSLMGGIGIGGLFAVVYILSAVIYLGPAYYLLMYAQRIGDLGISCGKVEFDSWKSPSLPRKASGSSSAS